ncbi:MAG: IPT/TIG domain-containing protein [Pseudomonadota bacterium]
MRCIRISSLALILCGALACSEDFGFNLIQNPQVDKVEPVEGPTKGGQRITITGEHFIENTQILFDDKPCRDIVIKSETVIECLTPVHDAGAAVVKAKHESSGEGDRTATYTFIPPPEFSLHPGDQVGFNVVNLNYCPSDFCTPDNEQEVAWRSLWIIQEDGVALSETTGQWEVRASYFHQVIEGASDPAAVATTWLSAYGPYDQAADYVDEGVGTYTTSVPPVPDLGGGAVSFPFFDMTNFDVAELTFRNAVKALDSEAAFESQPASRRLEAYYVDSGTPRLAHHVLIVFHSVGIVCMMTEEIAEASSSPSRSQGDFTGVLITPKSNLAFPWVQRVAGQKKFCNCASDTGCE